MNNELVAVIIPIYRNELNEYEKISLAQTLKVMSGYPIIYIMPEGFECSIDLQIGTIVRFPRIFFESIDSYNKLMVSECFYETFINYTYILICQLDVFIFKDELGSFCDLNYDYIGAPWLSGYTDYNVLNRRVLNVGNGGFSLRKVKKCLYILRNKPDLRVLYRGRNEDAFFSACAGKEFLVAPVDVALSFAFEREVRECYKCNDNKLPFGCHAWEKYDLKFLYPFIQHFGYVLSEEALNRECLDDNNKKEYEWLCRNTLLLKDDDEFYGLKKKIDSLWREKPIYLWGAGYWGQCIKSILNKNGINIVGFVDSNTRSEYCNKDINIFLSSEIERDSLTIVATGINYYDEIEKELKNLGKEYKKDYIFWLDLLPEKVKL